MKPENRERVIQALWAGDLGDERKAAARSRLLDASKLITLPPRRYIPRSHSERYLTTIIRGRVEVLFETDDGREVAIMLWTTGESFDLIRIFESKPPQASIRTLDEVELGVVPLDVVRATLADHPEFNQIIFDKVAERLATMSRRAAEFALSPTAVRLASLLVRNIHQDSSLGSQPRLIADLPHDALARLTGTVREVVSRHLAAWRRKGIVSMDNGRLHVADLEGLLAIADGIHLSEPI